MTIATGFLAKSAQIGGVTVSGAISFGLSQGGVPIDLRSDGELYPRVTPVIPTPIEVDIEGRDIAGSADAGTTGAMSLVADKMTGGKTLSGTVTYSAASSTILSVSRGTDLNGSAIVRISARVNSADGSTSGLTITSA
jgi:hypothetical protein